MNRTRIRQKLNALERVRTLRAVVLTVLYAAVLAASLWLAYQLRFDFDVPVRF